MSEETRRLACLIQAIDDYFRKIEIPILPLDEEYPDGIYRVRKSRPPYLEIESWDNPQIRFHVDLPVRVSGYIEVDDHFYFALDESEGSCSISNMSHPLDSQWFDDEAEEWTEA